MDRSRSESARPTAAISRSPAACPSVSLTALKRSTSSSRQRAAAAPAARVDLLGEDLLEGAAVQQAGERVMVGEVAQAVLGALAALDVLHLDEEVDRPVGVAHQRRAHQHPRRRPAMHHHGQLLPDGRLLPGHELAGAPADPRHVVREQDRADVAAAELLPRAPEQAGERVVDPQEAAVEGDDHHAHGRGVEGEAELLLGPPALLLLAPPVGDVGEGDDHGCPGVLRELHGRRRDREPAQLAVGAGHADHDAALLDAGPHRHHGGMLLAGQRRAVLAHGVPAPVERALAAASSSGGQPEDPLGGGVPGQDQAFGVLDDDALLERLEDGAVARRALYRLVPSHRLGGRTRGLAL